MSPRQPSPRCGSSPSPPLSAMRNCGGSGDPRTTTIPLPPLPMRSASTSSLMRRRKMSLADSTCSSLRTGFVDCSDCTVSPELSVQHREADFEAVRETRKPQLQPCSSNGSFDPPDKVSESTAPSTVGDIGSCCGGTEDIIGDKKCPSATNDWPSEIARAAFALAQRGDGAQILFATARLPTTNLKSILAAAGCRFSCDVVDEVVQSFFHAYGPLHDGSVFIYNGRIASARVPPYISWQAPMSGHGTRHYSARQFCSTFQPNVAAIVVSEERKVVTFFCGERVIEVASPNQLAEQVRSQISYV